MNTNYLFTSKRLGFRNWHSNDLEFFIKMNADTKVMRHFPKTLSQEESIDFHKRLLAHYEKHGFNYFATEILETKELIGFTGLAHQSYESKFTPAIDIGWRLTPTSWGNGFATEGAKRCLEYAFTELNVSKIISTCTSNNVNSERVMQKIGMTKKGYFNHPKLKDFPDFEKCVLYEISNQLDRPVNPLSQQF